MHERARLRHALGATIVVWLAVGACGSPPPSGSLPGSSAGSTASPSASPSPIDVSRTLRIGTNEPISVLSNAAADEASRSALPFIFNGLYQLDPTLAPVPDLAEEPCNTSIDGLTWTCSVREARFHSGLPLTAEDVAYTYELALSPRCTFRAELCLSMLLERVEATDHRTVVFTLAEPYAPFATLILPSIFIESKAALEDAISDVAEDAATLEPGALEHVLGLLSAVVEVLPNTPRPAVCHGAADAADELLVAIDSLDGPRRDDFNLAGPNFDEFDPCAYAVELEPFIAALALVARDPGIDAAASAYRYLPSRFAPLGTGPWQCVPGCLDPGESLTLSGFADHHFGPPVTEEVVMRMYGMPAEASQALVEGDVDWVQSAERYPEPSIDLADEPRIRLSEHSGLTYLSLQYNLRDGQRFADVGARKAVQHCIDKPALIKLATDGTGVAIEGYVPPGSWAHHSNLQTPARDTVAGMELLRQAGWTVEDSDRDGIADGVATRDGQPFSTVVPVRPGRPDRLVFLEGLRDQVIDCGIELEVGELHHVLSPVLEWPHIVPNQDRPFDAYFGEWTPGVDPDAFDIWHSSQCTTEQQPDLWNHICFDDAEADRLIEAGLRVSDPDQRAAIYRDLQELIYEQQPHLFAWSELATDAFDRRLTSTSAELQLESPRWDWQLETLYLAE